MKSVLIFLCFLNYAHSLNPTVKVDEGELAGKIHTLAGGRIINAFLGVPYAAPPIFENRFKEPQPLKPWIGTWNASAIQNKCLQLEYNAQNIYAILGNEDCLYINIYTPKLPKNGKNPQLNVLVYIHGGGFMFGSGRNELPDYLLKIDDIVFVTLAYRLGILGFLSTNDNEAPGNYGMKDQVAALKWIKRNIAYFGGNPTSITIIGASAGGASVHYHMISPLSEGLFQKAISLSGTTIHPWTLPRNVTQKSIQLASLVGCPISNTRDLVKCLQTRSPTQLVEASKNFMMWRYCPFTSFGPVVEPQSSNAFLSIHPFDLLKTGKVKDLPWMVTMVRDEGLYPAAEFIHSDVYLKELNDGWNEIAPNLLMYNFSVPEVEKDKVSAAIKRFYFQEKPISKETVNILVQLIGDRLFFNGIIDAAVLHNFVTKANIYCYKFNYHGEYSFTHRFTKNTVNYGVSHGDDFFYFLKNSRLPLQTDSDLAVSKLMSSFIINFMNSGDPNKVVSNWQPIAKNQNTVLNCLNIYSATNLRMENVSSNSRVSKFWKSTIPWEQSIVKVNHSCKHFVAEFLLIFSFSLTIMFF